MASPAPMPPAGAAWTNTSQGLPPQAEADDSSMQPRPMGLKVHYTFDQEAKVNCLARYPQSIPVQTIPIDESNTIGLVDLRTCIHAITECSPELAGHESDYTIYAHDYSEPDTPLVGQGTLSRVLESMQGGPAPQQPKLVTGRVTKNLLAIFAGGNRETLEVKLKLSAATKSQRSDAQYRLDMSRNGVDTQQNRPTDSAMTPTSTTEWNNFIQGNPQIGQPSNVPRVSSPAQGFPPSQMPQGPPQQGYPPAADRRGSFGPVSQQGMQNMMGHEAQRIAPAPVDPNAPPPLPAASRPSSRTSSRPPRRKQPTGRPRGRPRKKPAEGNTSGYEDGTEGEEGPAKKRAKVTQVDKTPATAFGAAPDSLRVAASTSGSLRNFRPVNSVGVPGSHLQEVPRAPTPVPIPQVPGAPSAAPKTSSLRRESTMATEYNPNQNEAKSGLSPPNDGRSPDSVVPTPMYSDDSPLDIGSSPPVPRTTPFMRSSPPQSSPILPPMPQAQPLPELGFFTEDDLFGEESFTLDQNVRQPEQLQQTKVIEAEDISGAPVKVFRMEDGPDGRNMVQIYNYNSQPPFSAPQHDSASVSHFSQPPIRPRPTRPQGEQKPSAPSPPVQGPTPPPTTDAIEKSNSPVVEMQPSPEPGANEAAGKPEESRLSPASDPAQLPRPSSAQSNPPKAAKPRPRPARKLNRSQSAGPLALPIPASEPAGPSSLAQSTNADLIGADPVAPVGLRRSASTGPLSFPIPASDPAPAIAPPMPAVPEVASDAVPPPSSPPAGRSKNFVKKHAIKQRLEEAIMNGEMPPYCSNCGAIETPTWRKIWVQEREGIPEYTEYSEKPGRVTAIEILKRDEEDKPTSYRLVKKNLGATDDKTEWHERLLCNPCGIWLVKWRCHRPQDRWEKDASRLGQERRRKNGGGNNSRKRSRAKSDAQANPTSEAYIATDAVGPAEPADEERAPSQEASLNQSLMANDLPVGMDNSGTQSQPGSTHSRASGGSAKSPIEVEFDNAVGATRRLLFPSPRKDGVPKVLNDVDVNIVRTSPSRQSKEASEEKENMTGLAPTEPAPGCDELESLFKGPSPPRPSTPPPDSGETAPSGPLKTPTRSTPSHRPITRSVSKSIKSVRSVASPSHRDGVQKTPTKTPRGSRLAVAMGAASVRRSPRNHPGTAEGVFETPITRSINQMMSDNNFFSDDFDFNNLPELDDSHVSFLDFSAFLSTDAPMPSSPPKAGGSSLANEYAEAASAWPQWNA